jgi:hypothetical protein
MKSFLRRRELVHERRKANLAEPLATRILLPCTARNVVHLTLKRSFSTQSDHSIQILQRGECSLLQEAANDIPNPREGPP